MPPLRPQTEPVGIISLVSGVIAMAANCCCAFFGIPFSVIAIITGIVSLMRIRNNPERFTGKVYGWIGIAIGVGGILILIVSVLVGIGPAVLEEIKRNL